MEATIEETERIYATLPTVDQRELRKIPDDAVAFWEGNYFNKEEAIEWLKAEEQRALEIYNKSSNGKVVRGAHAHAAACAELAKKIKKGGPPLKKPCDLELELGKIQDRMLGAK